jgi:hypothetical protein
MALNNTAQNITNLIPSFVEMTPYQVYIQQIRGTTDNIRFTNMGLNYIPPQFGGLTGQLQTITGGLVLQLVDFQVGKGNS